MLAPAPALSVTSSRSQAGAAGGVSGTEQPPVADTASRGAARLAPVPHALALAAVALFVILFIVSSALALQSYGQYESANSTTSAATGASNGLLIELLNAETGQRGYLLTNRAIYLQPYDRARSAVPADLRRLGAQIPAIRGGRQYFAKLSDLAGAKMAELARTIQLSRAGDHAAARRIVDTNEGEQIMDQARTQIADIQRAAAAAGASRRSDLHRKLTIFAALAAVLAAADVGGLLFLRRRLSASRGQAEDDLRKMNAELEERVTARTADLAQSNRNLEAFTYSLAHDLRSPLRASSGFSEALLEEYGDRLDDTGRGYAQRVVAAARRMGGLIDDLLDLSKVSRGTLRLETVNLSAEAADIAAELQRRDPERQARFTIQAGVRASVDGQLVRSVLQNLFDNAWKFTATRDEATIEFGTTTLDESSVACYVRDNGVGFDPAYRDKLFEPFQRLHSYSEFPGNGIGLASVRRIIERHGGRIWAEGAVGQGAAFYFTLNVETARAGQHPQRGPGPPRRGEAVNQHLAADRKGLSGGPARIRP